MCKQGSSFGLVNLFIHTGQHTCSYILSRKVLISIINAEIGQNLHLTLNTPQNELSLQWIVVNFGVLYSTNQNA